MNVKYPSINSRVHAETELVKKILSYPIKKRETLAKVCGCSVSYVARVRVFKRLQSHVFLSPESIRALNENR